MFRNQVGFAFFIAAMLCMALPPTADSAPVGTGFTYQGQLIYNSARANGPYDLQFKLYDLAAEGTQIGATISQNDVSIADGLFTVKLDFGAGAFGGGARWLEIAARPGASAAAYTLLTPRQELAPAPYAMAMPNVYTDEGQNFVGIGRNFRISGNEVFGVRYTGGANQYGGMYVETSNPTGWPFYGYATNGSFRAWTYFSPPPPIANDTYETSNSWVLYNGGIRLTVPATGGLRIGPALNYSLVIKNTTGSDGIRVLDTGDDAIQIGSNPDIANYGVYIPSPGVSTYGLWPNTSNAAGEWALYTVDKIRAGNVAASSLSVLSKVTGTEALSPGDVAAAVGVADALPDSTTPLALVRRSDAAKYTGVVGVVESRMVYEVAPGKEEEKEMGLRSSPGAAQPGDYVSLVVMGVAEVKVDPAAAISVGNRITASSQPGQVRALRTTLVGDMPVTEGAPVIGVALAAPVKGKATIPVFVTLR